MSVYRKLTPAEIATLTVYGCSAEDWQKVNVATHFTPHYIHQVHFSGEVYLGTYNKIFHLPGGLKKHAGINNCCIHNCVVENDVFIDKVHNYIANYHIGEGAYIENVNLILVDQETAFGNGRRVSVLNEAGGREVPIYDFLSAPIAYILTIYRHKSSTIQWIEKCIDDYTQRVKSAKGYIGKHCQLINTGSVKDVKIGEFSVINGASQLENGTIVSNESAPVLIGSGVQCKDFIISSGVTVADSSLISSCFLGQGTHIAKHYSAIDSLFFSNCQGFHGEATAVFAGPYTVTHHKSTLLIGGMYSFFNAGSGTNQSNHGYKLGPIHQGICERGTKTSSDSYILWPAKIGAFSLVMGRHYSHPDTSDLPFSYLLEQNSSTYLVPAVNLKTVGTIRDAQKWMKRDNRTDDVKLDPINFKLFNAYTLERVLKGVSVLNELKSKVEHQTEIEYNHTKMKVSSLQKGIELYELAIDKFIGGSFVRQLEEADFSSLESFVASLAPTTEVYNEWVDLSGLVAPKELINGFLDRLVIEKYDLPAIQSYLAEIHTHYDSYEWAWIQSLLIKKVNKEWSSFGVNDFIQVVEKWNFAESRLNELIYNDAKKEFDVDAKMSFGADGDAAIRDLDFEAVRGFFESNSFVLGVQSHVEEKQLKGNEMIEKLRNLK